MTARSASPPPRPAPGQGRRERNKADKRQRIFAAADRLFAELGYTAVTTAQIADEADVGTGTVFRYFASKADLLVEVMSDKLRVGREHALELADAGADPVEAILALVEPLVLAGATHPENTAVYHREALFAPAPEVRRRTREVAELEDAIDAILSRGTAAPEAARRMTAHAVYATLFVDVVRVTVDATAPDAAALTDTLRRHVTFLLSRLLPASADDAVAGRK
ncbi:transcriptional regulator, TetR family [Jatrophihabitans endophyticus]|uniref:Transcriptional regulator, TetR family n=1 Tax=Jatrophihabitans endophyticus TaxID=1206085 RepID=A0A1M5M1J7_9ACTN|nr:TetR/AcrR family transcriptional regulator [Jatrophihabitans endophyticus]SHG71126.1 transcriptional regulator, TetR family [Jatrophihabitans endophyticus]